MRDSFTRFSAKLNYPMYIVTTSDGRERAGCLVGFATQCSIHPPRFIVCISKKNRTFRVVRHSETVVVHLVPHDCLELAELFGSETGDRVDKFERCDWRAGPGGAPILELCSDWFAARIEDRIDPGDHVTLLLEPLEVDAGHAGAPLTFERVKTLEPGHEP
jgi:flavin reductase (DIM6/NTAB) family NADH-FMN oxidoreductase RutF